MVVNTMVITLGLVIVMILVLASVFVNGWTDAPNAIATVVSTRVMSPRAAVIMAAIFNLFGVLLMGTAVANTIGNICKLVPGNEALAVIGAAQLSIVLWATAAWRFGIPTSESHALIAGLTGAGLASSRVDVVGFAAVDWDSWVKVFQGLGISSVLGFFSGFVITWLVVFVFKRTSRGAANSFFSKAQVVSAAAMAFSHGTQDGQKFMGVMALSLMLGGVLPPNTDGKLSIPLWIMLLCSVIMALGTSVGGYRIIKTMGMDMVKLEKYQGFSAEVAASLCLLGSTVFGIPVSTTHTKTTAIMGVGLQKGFRGIKWSIVMEMFTAWVLTFPVCLIIGFLMTKLFLAIF
ncbi:MAG: inorganic phosphate transporter [Spirochaetaceae bacterium]|nr:MAG: inorganic phosphate transporter [Spirochaetaceae bacterium]